MEVYNPFQDIQEDLDCTFECHIDSKGVLDYVETHSVESKAGVELFDYLDTKILEQLADDFKNKYGEWV